MANNKDPEHAPPDFHHVSINIKKVSPMSVARNPHQSITAVLDAKTDFESAIALIKILVDQVARHQPGMGPITFTIEGDFS